jgi:GNAT superfamily N-acetyltransferase
MDVVKPLDATADWYAELAERDCARELQAFYDANPEYWKLTHGHGPQPNAAEEGFDVQPPADMTYTSLPDWLIRLRGSDRIVGQVAVATDLMAAGVTHLGFFMIETARHASGFGDELYAAYERWAIDQGARWLRLGVVERHFRAQRFWQRHGYIEVCRRRDYALGDLRHTLLVMVKPIASDSLDAYLERVPRDRPVARA